MQRTVADVIEHLFTTANPESGSQPPEMIAWVVFANGTTFFTAPSDDLPFDATIEELAVAARQALHELGPVVIGTPAGDFAVSRLDAWFPGESVYFITYDHPSVANIVFGDDGERMAGLVGRGLREADYDTMQIATIRDFGGRQHRPD